MNTLISLAQVLAYTLTVLFTLTLLSIALQAVKLTKVYKYAQNYIVSVSMYVIDLFSN